MIERYQLLNEPGRTICIFEKNGKYFGHILKDRTDKAPAKLVFETPKYDSLDALKLEYPSKSQ
ncbi:hypothetical protein [Paenibacillus radicis (ex Xue et al. 2023)]|uniref:Uncharacterized protein n=1 Tax=Paenibacillus radicis (ex Xue et al. 2023) TaxID=2972489 RepID=A0ABT1YJZ8_9BACL|nr:hypothetical protein [Paenibacillus radicis (ex Xue et al. 2023)]MCR8633518.1 hypothetical protein [Paenibacillus radicis (ex Xue et al. 2023)]